jgi:hypothetical protein
MALTDDELVDQAAIKNWETIKSRLDSNVVSEKIEKIYQMVLEMRKIGPI